MTDNINEQKHSSAHGDLSVEIAGVRLKNPIIPASGTFGFGREYAEFYSLEKLGAIAVKGLTLEPRMGNPPPRIAETPSGILNSVGLQNPGIQNFIQTDLPWLKQFDVPVIANIAGNTVDEYVRMAELLRDTATDLIELNISCPNVKEGGVAFGTSCTAVAQVTQSVKSALGDKPLIVKLTPNVTNIVEIAQAAEKNGADALSLINTLVGMKIDIVTRRPVLFQNIGGLSGPAVHPVAVRMVWEVARAVSVPVIGMGGVMTGDDAIEMMLAGATAVSVGTAILADPYAPLRILSEMARFLSENSIESVREIIGGVVPN
jgi:dihydroorotate dehydrogenase (NAD+) catalytic subunit